MVKIMDFSISINYLAVIFAAIVNLSLGFLWFGRLFGKKWIMSGWDKEKNDAQKVRGEETKSYLVAGLAFLGSLAMGTFLSFIIINAERYLNISRDFVGPVVAFYIWIGILVPISLSRMLWDGKPYLIFEGRTWKHWIIINGYYLIGLIVMGIILASF